MSDSRSCLPDETIKFVSLSQPTYRLRIGVSSDDYPMFQELSHYALQVALDISLRSLSFFRYLITLSKPR